MMGSSENMDTTPGRKHEDEWHRNALRYNRECEEGAFRDLPIAKTKARAYLTNRMESVNELRIWRYNWGRTAQLFSKEDGANSEEITTVKSSQNDNFGSKHAPY